MRQPTGITLVIPAWNEAEAIGSVLDEIPADLVDQTIVVVGSDTDPTREPAERRGARVVVQRMPGYGAACWTGADIALHEGARIIAFIDGDYADPPAELTRVTRPLLEDQADLVLGCRDLRHFPDALPPHARIGNALVCSLLRVLLGTGFRDLPSCKAIRANAFRQLNMREMTYGWTVEMLVKAARRGLRIQQLDLEYRPRRGGQSKVAGDVRASLRAACRLLGCAVIYATPWGLRSTVGGR